MFPLRSIGALRSTPRAFRAPRIQARHFHPTRPTQSVIETVLSGSTAVIHGVHTASFLPWAASIPLTAVLIRCFVGFPLQFYSRVRAQEEKLLQPLLSSWSAVYKEVAARQVKGTKEQNVFAMKKLQERSKVLYGAWNISKLWRPLMFLQIPVFLAFMEGLRGMSGNSQGLAAWLISWGGSSDPAAAAQTLSSRLEPSFATEGALWFPDLLAGDPTGTLPALLTLSILSNVMSGWKVKTFKEISDLPKIVMYKEMTFRGLRIFVQVLACQVGIMSFVNQLPTALLLYWITSTNLATLQTWILDKKVFTQAKRQPFQRRYVAFEKPGNDDPYQLKNLR
ncbi:unnamed protein product [Penicillium olsonii]|uniref:Membrane insertase YidC/Oxa/ALB C-terminal domain-containing protein n=1 Tax=Penicillium olsonii TaxID=99116 RepID=A0A9W4MXG5_PENOL|nr:unnamed protein product [Penicillium olsonii]CAG8165954.1 unnamed protein product [Penicillium olsonii]